MARRFLSKRGRRSKDSWGSNEKRNVARKNEVGPDSEGRGQPGDEIHGEPSEGSRETSGQV